MMVAGFGFRAGASPESLRAALHLALAGCGVAPLRPSSLLLLATAHDKAGAGCLQALAASLQLPIRAIAAAEMASMATLTDRAPVRARRGTGSVAEAAALAGAQQLSSAGAALLHPRAVSPDRLATCAIASFTPLSGIDP